MVVGTDGTVGWRGYRKVSAILQVEIEISCWFMVMVSHMYFQFEASMDSRVALLRKNRGGKVRRKGYIFLYLL